MVMLSIIYNITYIILLYILWIREGVIDDTSDGSGKSDGWYKWQIMEQQDEGIN